MFFHHVPLDNPQIPVSPPPVDLVLDVLSMVKVMPSVTVNPDWFLSLTPSLDVDPNVQLITNVALDKCAWTKDVWMNLTHATLHPVDLEPDVLHPNKETDMPTLFAGNFSQYPFSNFFLIIHFFSRCEPGLIPNPDTITGCKPECIRDPDCSSGYVCENQRCIEKPDPCDPSPCGPGARCMTNGNGNAICRY